MEKTRPIRVCIDAGHGGKDAGAVNGGLFEKAVNLKIAKLLYAELRKKGFSVILTRGEDVALELQERCYISNNFSADLFVSIHCNSAENKTAHGVETWYFRTSEAGYEFAKCIQTELAKIDGVRDRGVKSGTFHVLRKTKAVAVLVELGFISNNEDEKLKLFKRAYQDKLCLAIVNGLLNHVKRA